MAYVPPYPFAPNQHIEYRLQPHNPLPTPRARASVGPIGDDTQPQVHLFGSQPAGSLVATSVVASPLIRFTGNVTVAGVTDGDWRSCA